MLTQVMLLCFLVSAPQAAMVDDVQEMARSLRSEAPDLALQIDQMQPLKNRAGGLYFPGADLMSPTGQVLIQDRILARRDGAQVRAALVYALNQDHRFPWSVIEQEVALVRTAMLHGYKGLDTQESAEVLALALADSDPGVRAEAVRLIGYRTQWDGLSQPLVAALQDDASEVRRLSARSLGWLGVREGFTPLRTLLQDPSPDVRAAAVRALGKIDMQAARSLPAFKQLSAQETHPAVQRELRRVVGP